MSNTIIKQNSKSIFGHNCKFTGYAGDVSYLHYRGKGIIDGIGRQHIDLYGTCDICGKEIRVARIHVKSNSILYGEEHEQNY